MAQLAKLSINYLVYNQSNSRLTYFLIYKTVLHKMIRGCIERSVTYLMFFARFAPLLIIVLEIVSRW